MAVHDSPLGRSGVNIGRRCLGTLTRREPSGGREAHAPPAPAFAAGIDCIDSAEIYPLLAGSETIHAAHSHPCP